MYIEGILPKGPYLPCVSMAGRALLTGYHRCVAQCDPCLTARSALWLLMAAWHLQPPWWCMPIIVYGECHNVILERPEIFVIDIGRYIMQIWFWSCPTRQVLYIRTNYYSIFPPSQELCFTHCRISNLVAFDFIVILSASMVLTVQYKGSLIFHEEGL